MFRFRMAIVLVVLSCSSWAVQAEYRLSVQPLYDEQHTREVYAPLAEWMSGVLGQPVRIVTQPDFLHYGLSQDDPEAADFILDSVHFAAFRAEYRNFQMLARVDNPVTWTLAVGSDSDAVEPRDLLSGHIATLSAPSMASVALAELYSNPLRQPRLLEVKDVDEGIAAVRDDRASAVMLPTSLLPLAPELVPIYQTRPFPGLVFSASPLVSDQVQAKLRRALLTASFNAQGQQMLERLRLTRFIPAERDALANYARLLGGLWAENRNALAPLARHRFAPLTLGQVD